MTENEELGEIVSIGEMAHNVGWSENSPRGHSSLTDIERAAPENLLLLCRNCHKPVDSAGAMGRYSVPELQERKKEHERRIRLLSEVAGDRKATLIRVVGNIRGTQPELDRDTTLAALVRSGVFPEFLPNAYFPEYELDLRLAAEPYGANEFAHAAKQVDALAARVQQGIGLGAVTRLAVFGFARIPVLVHLGARLDDKIETLIFQRQRVDGDDAWSWPEDGSEVTFELSQLHAGSADRVAAVFNLSGTIHLDELPSEQREASTIYAVAPVPPAMPGPDIVTSPATLANFGKTVRALMALIESEHPDATEMDLFMAVPVSAAIAIGRTIMSDVSPTARLFDRGEGGQFFKALEVKR